VDDDIENRRTHLSRLVIVIATLASAIATTLVLLDGPAPFILDAEAYWTYGQSVASGDWLLMHHAIAYRTPGYPWFLAMCQTLGGQYAIATMVVVQGGMCIASVPLCGWIVSNLMPPPHRSIAFASTCVLMALGVSRLYFAKAALGETCFVFIMLLHLGCTTMVITSSRKYRWAIAMGGTLALMILVRPIGQWLWLAHLILWGAWWWQTAKSDWQIRRTIAITLLLGTSVACLMIAPWWYRNGMMFGEPFLTQFIGRNIWIVTFQDQAGAGLPLPTSPEADALRSRVLSFDPSADLTKTWNVSGALSGSGLRDDEVDRQMKRVAIQAIAASPVIWTERFLRRLVNFFRCVSDLLPSFAGTNTFPADQVIWNVPTQGEATLNSLRFAPRLGLNMLVMFAFFVSWVWLVCGRVHRTLALWIGAMVTYFTIVTCAIEIPDYRYRLVVEPLMAMTGGAAVAKVFAKGMHP
jgi:hypothetical protein